MSYLNLPSLAAADSTKGTISLWFRVSQDSVDKAREHGESYNYDDMRWDILRGTIPLVTFGRKVDGIVWNSEGRLDCTCTDFNGTTREFYSFHPANPVSSPREPSHIGLSCWGAGSLMSEDHAIPTLVMVFQTQSIPSVAGLYNERVECHCGTGGLQHVLYETLYEASYVRASWPVAFYIWPSFKVETDKWHHLLVSWDFSTPVDTVATEHFGPNEPYVDGKNISGACKFYYSFDDENKTGQKNISEQPFGAWAYKGPNDVVPEGAFLADFNYTPHDPATDILGIPLATGNVDAIPQWHFSPSPLPLRDGHVGAPAGAEYVDNVYHVEMAEFQMFIGVTVDTGVERNRRAFVDENGKPVKPTEGATKNDPRGLAEKLMGKKPDVMLHGSSNWKTGKNTGTLGIEINTEGEETIIPGGQFEPTGVIKRYTPDPSLTETPTA